MRESVPPPLLSSIAIAGDGNGDGSNPRKVSNWVEFIRTVSLPLDGSVTRYWSTNVKSPEPGNSFSTVQSPVANSPSTELAGVRSTTCPQAAACGWLGGVPPSPPLPQPKALNMPTAQIEI